jgi:hypothetical protein
VPRTPPPLACVALALIAAATVAGASPSGAPDGHAHPVWGPALAAEAASLAADAPARTAAAGATQRASHGLSGWAQLRPALTWRSNAADPASTVTAAAGAAWRLDPVAAATARLDQHRADVAAHERALRAVRAVTSAYLALRRAHVALDLAEAALPARRATLARAEAGLLAGSVPRHQVDVALLDLERSEAALERAARDLSAARRDAARHGIDVDGAAAQHHQPLRPEPLEGWRLPPPPDDLPHESLLRRRLERDLAAARLERRGGWSVLDDVRIEASVREQGARLRAGSGLDQGRPHAWADVTWTGSGSDAWSVGISARVRIDDTWRAELERAERAHAEAEAALALAEADAAWSALEARRALAEAEVDVVLAERSLDLGRAALRDLAAELEAASAERRALARGVAHDEAALAAATARVERFEAAYRRAELGHQRERDAFMRAWERYLREAERLWAGVGWPFGAVPGGGQ